MTLSGHSPYASNDCLRGHRRQLPFAEVCSQRFQNHLEKSIEGTAFNGDRLAIAHDRLAAARCGEKSRPISLQEFGQRRDRKLAQIEWGPDRLLSHCFVHGIPFGFVLPICVSIFQSKKTLSKIQLCVRKIISQLCSKNVFLQL
jgi:hypothetical protein